MKEPTLIITGDGSASLLSEKFNVSFHSKHGAIQETAHVFINAGLLHFNPNDKLETNILEVGFGTGLNAFMTFLKAFEVTSIIHYTTYESSPIALKTAKDLNYIEQLDANAHSQSFMKMHESLSQVPIKLSNKFIFTKVINEVQNLDETNKFDIVFFDAFAPTSQPELWTEQMFSKIFKAMRKDGILVTFCAKGVVKRALKSTGFKVESIPGPPGKREMTRAIK